MGWSSTADPLENVGRTSLSFPTKEHAMAFCRKVRTRGGMPHGSVPAARPLPRTQESG